MPKDKTPPGSGKNKGSLTQKADDQDVRISQVSNVSAAVSAMGKKTTREMQETERRIAEGGDTKEVAGSMNSVLMSLKKTVDSLEKGVQVATLGTAKAAQDAIKQYGEAISEDFKINRTNFVASSLAASTPVVGYFASKLLETGILKKTKDSISEKISGMFKRKEKGGTGEFDLGGEDIGMGMNGKEAAQAMKISRQQQKEFQKQSEERQKKSMVGAFTQVFKTKHKEYEEPVNAQILSSLNAIRDYLVREEEKEKFWTKFFREHPLMSLPFKPVAAFFMVRGGWKRFLSKSRNPLTAINANIATTFLQLMPRLDALMVYTRATAEAIRDLSTHTTKKTYPAMDPSRLGATWSMAGTTWKAIKFMAVDLPSKALTAYFNKLLGPGSQFRDDPQAQKIWLALTKQRKGIDLKRAFMGKREKLFYDEEKRLMKSALGETSALEAPEGGEGSKRLIRVTTPRMIVVAQQVGLMHRGMGRKALPGPTEDIMDAEYTVGPGPRRIGKDPASKIPTPKFVKGMGPKMKPHVLTQNVYDLYKINKDKEKDKASKKLLKANEASSKYLKEHDKREKRRSMFGFFGSIFKNIGGLITSAFGLLGPIFMMLKGGATKWISSLFLKGGAIRTALGTLFTKGGPLATALTSPWLWGAIGAGLLGAGIGTAINNWLISPWLDGWYDKEEKKQKKGMQVTDKTRAKLLEQAKGGDWSARMALSAAKGIKGQKTWFGTALTSEAVRSGQMRYIARNKRRYAKYSEEEIEKARTRWRNDIGYLWSFAKMSTGEKEPEKFGWEKEQHFLEYLEKVGTPEKKADLRRVSSEYRSAMQKTQAGQAKKDVAVLITAEQVQKLANEYNVPAEKLKGKTLAEATTYAKKYKEEVTKKETKITDKIPENVKQEAAIAAGYAKEKTAVATTWWGKQWEAMKNWGAPKRTGEYIELGKGNFVEIYRQGTGALKEMWETAAPEKKAIIRRQLEAALASGQITAEQLKSMGIQLKDAAMEAGSKMENAIAQSAVYQTTNISNAVQSGNPGVANPAASSFLQEKSMNEIGQGQRLN